MGATPRGLCPVLQLSTRNSSSSVADFHHAPMKTCRQEPARHPQGQVSLRMWPKGHPSRTWMCSLLAPPILCFPGQRVGAQDCHPWGLSLHPSTSKAGRGQGVPLPRFVLRKIWESRCCRWEKIETHALPSVTVSSKGIPLDTPSRKVPPAAVCPKAHVCPTSKLGL